MTATDQVTRLVGEGTDRLGALSDGLFAIVLTLLVLQFEVPEIPPEAVASELLPSLLALQPLLFSYVLSFTVVGLYWVVHHDLFSLVERHDRVLLYLNLLFLLLVSFLPFPTELIGTYGTRLTWALYAVNLATIGLLMTAIWSYAALRGFTNERVDGRTARFVTVRGLIGPAVFALSILVSLLSLDLAYATPLLIVPLRLWWSRTYRASSGSPL